MSYLDRPSPAGYFIFPDLSVRHEGKYRLSFQLFEETRDENDKDAVDPTASMGGTGELYFGRCQVKSKPFTVYSAKKFPGLAESTHLSRMVADQGCRVRIRRDVRMRRRDNKDSKDWDDFDDKMAGDRQRRTASPETQTQANASSPEPVAEVTENRPSNNHALAVSSDRQATVHEGNQQYQQYPHQYAQSQQQAPPPPPPHPHGYAPHVQYDPAAMAQYQQAQYMHQQQVAQSPQQMQYPQYPYGYPPQPMVQYPSPYYMPQPQAPQQISQQSPASMYEQQMNHMRPEGITYAAPPQPPQQYQSQTMAPPHYSNGQMASPFGTMAHGYGRMTQPPSPTYPTPQSASSQTSHGNDLPPLKALETFPGKFEAPSPSVSMSGDRASAYASYATADVPPPSQYITSAPAASKRAYGSVFNTQHIDQPLRLGARPSLASGAVQDLMMASAGEDGSDEEIIDMESLKMQYRRADGTQISRRWPTTRV